ncbi:MAG TPA: class I SAM-dependent methyltransferase [Jiangellales bacterium]|nr:class I SAM-dependent methyltransferase [Jiangellales bacterium]
MSVRGTVASPNIWQHPQVYEVLNRANDPDGLVDAALRDARPWDDAVVADVGCGTGYHLPRYAATARTVVGVEPHAGLATTARRRCAGLRAVWVRQGTAQALPLPDASVDVVHARWAYFFGPGCEPGLAETRRVLRRGGTVAVVDVDSEVGEYGRWFRAAYPDRDPAVTERFWARQGFTTVHVPTTWRFGSRADLESVLGIEFPPAVAERALAEVDGSTITVGQVVRHRTG